MPKINITKKNISSYSYTNIFVFQEHSVVKKRSVAELAGKFSCPISHMTDAEVVRFHIIRI